ncbi:MAG: phosphatidate cytidylyltransferase [Thermodesulfobacteriota bacterium]
MILTRVLTGLTLIVAVYLVVFHSPRLIFFLLVLAAIFLSLREFYQLVIPEAAFLGKLVGMLLALGMATLIYLDQYSLAVNILALGIILLAAINMVGSGELVAALANTGLILLGTLYAGLLLTFLIVIRNSNQGQELVFLVFLLTWAQDVAAFFVGRAWGSRKLYPRLSPGKTWEGFLAGLLVSALVAVISWPFLVRELSLLVRLFLGLGVGLIGPLGDLFESMIKRSAGAKDSGRLLPGHGGLLDRLDSLLFSAPFAYLYLRVFLPLG